MEPKPNPFKRNFLRAIPYAPLAPSLVALGYEGIQGGISFWEHVYNNAVATALSRNQYLQSQHEKVIETYNNLDIPLHPEFGPWHSIERMGLLKGANHASENIFLTEEESNKATSLIDGIYTTYTGINMDHAEIQKIYDTWFKDSLHYSGYSAGFCVTHHVINLLHNETPAKKNPEEPSNKVKPPVEFNRRNLLKLALAGSAYGAWYWADQAMHVQPLSKSLPNIQYPTYKEFPAAILAKLHDPASFQRLNSFISPENLSARTFFTTKPISEVQYEQAKVDQLGLYEKGLSDSSFDRDKKNLLEKYITHVNESSYGAYAKRLGYALWALDFFGREIPTVGPSDPLLSISVDGKESILDSGAGLGVNYAIATNQSVYHGTTVRIAN